MTKDKPRVPNAVPVNSRMLLVLMYVSLVLKILILVKKEEIRLALIAQLVGRLWLVVLNAKRVVRVRMVLGVNLARLVGGKIKVDKPRAKTKKKEK